MTDLLLLQASPHVHGVGDLVFETISQALPPNLTTKTLFLRTAKIEPCSGCRLCDRPPHTCHLDFDQAAMILEDIVLARLVLFSAPIYFYHLPAQAKALIDRSQCFWIRKNQKQSKITSLKKRTLVVLTAARSQGQFLFQGALLTLKYFFEALDREIIDTCLLSGLETRADLAANKPMLSKLQTFLTKHLDILQQT
ncbi:MAG: flavodoxin family protein [Desulfovibrionaceae bacterium]|nr:flavodoxin family protein [Desulfovibrionaceae bacterium]